VNCRVDEKYLACINRLSEQISEVRRFANDVNKKAFVVTPSKKAESEACARKSY